MNETIIRDFLYDYSQKHSNKSTYANVLKALKCYFKHYLKSNIMDSFKFPKQPFIPKHVPTKEQLTVLLSIAYFEGTGVIHAICHQWIKKE